MYGQEVRERALGRERTRGRQDPGHQLFLSISFFHVELRWESWIR